MNILLVGPYAPHGQVGAIRVISLSRYLAEKGHKVSVVCLSEATLEKMDAKGLTAKIPEGVEVCPYDITLDCKSLLKRNYINERECTIAVEKILEKREIDVVFVSGGPFYAFRAMKSVRTRGIPYVVDYRDLHLSSPDKRKRKGIVNKIKFWLSYPLRYYQEFSCIRPANAITVVSPEMADSLSDYFHIDRDKFHVVYNGYDDAVLKGLDLKSVNSSFLTIGYFGKLMYYNQAYTVRFFRAIERLNAEGKKVSLLHVGPENPVIQETLEKFNLNGAQWYHCTGQMDYREGIEILSGCNACALEYIFPEGPGTKIFDYIYLNKPVIGITKPGIPLEDMLRSFDHAYVCHSDEDVEQAIYELIQNNITALIDGEQAQERIASYSRSRQNAVFEDIMKGLIGEAG